MTKVLPSKPSTHTIMYKNGATIRKFGMSLLQVMFGKSAKLNSVVFSDNIIKNHDFETAIRIHKSYRTRETLKTTSLFRPKTILSPHCTKIRNDSTKNDDFKLKNYFKRQFLLQLRRFNTWLPAQVHTQYCIDDLNKNLRSSFTKYELKRSIGNLNATTTEVYTTQNSRGT